MVTATNAAKTHKISIPGEFNCLYLKQIVCFTLCFCATKGSHYLIVSLTEGGIPVE